MSSQVEFLAPIQVKLRKNKPKLLEGFRVLRADGCAAAFHAPVELTISGRNVRGVANTVRLRVASVSDLLVMKAHAMAGRDKPKDAYDLCYCLQHFAGGMRRLAADWRQRRREKEVGRAIEILREKFATVESFGSQQFVEFHNSPEAEERARHARLAYELVHEFLKRIGNH
jgi:predicted nucleotidyltransferase